MNVRVWQLDIKVILLNDIYLDNIMTKVAYFVDSAILKASKWTQYHNSNNPKLHCFNSLYPIEKSGLYKHGNIYTIQIRTVYEELKNYLLITLGDNKTREMKTLSVACKELKYKKLDKIISVTPLILKTTGGYWKEYLLEREFLEELKINILKKYRDFFNVRLEDNIEIFKGVEFLNRCPVSKKYKDIKIVGDKVILKIEDNLLAQKLAFFSLGTGCGCMSARGFSFVNPRWKR